MARNGEVRIEHLEPGRLDDLIEAQNEIFSDYVIQIRSTRQFFMDFMSSVGGSMSRVLVALDGPRIVGYVNPVVDGHEGWIGGIGVRRDYRGKGIGTRLMQTAEDECRRDGVTEISLEVIEGNDRAQRLYERLGYVFTKKFLSAEGRPIRFEGFGENPRKATLSEVAPMHAAAYRDACWQRRKTESLVQSAKSADIFRVDGGFVMLRSIDTSGFISFLGVLPDMRGKGVGTSLAKFALSRLWDLGAFKVSLFNVGEDVTTLRMLDKFDFLVTMKQIEMRKTL